MDEQSAKQKRITFAQSEHVEAVISILKDISRQEKLVGSTEYETLVNAITMDTQSQMIINFINHIEFIKQGGLINTQP